jgi:hypothetical protein
MVPTMSERNERRGGGKILGLGVLAGLVALAMAYFGKCIPGFGVGGSSAPSSSTSEPAKSEPAKAGAGASAVKLVVDGERCQRDGEQAQACDALCAALAAGDARGRIEIDGTLGTHAAVDGLRKCLVDAGFQDVVVRAE